MKKISLIAFCLVGAVILIAATNENSTNELKSLEGVWELENQYLFDDNEVLDTLDNLNGYRQVKMYSKGKVMWSRYNLIDESEWFGYGSYKIVDGFLEERLEYGSKAMMKIVDTVQVFRFELEIRANSYSQYTLDNKGNRESSENYTKIE